MTADRLVVLEDDIALFFLQFEVLQELPNDAALAASRWPADH